MQKNSDRKWNVTHPVGYINIQEQNIHINEIDI